MTTDLEILAAPPEGMRPISTRLHPRSDKPLILTMIADAERQGKQSAIVRRDRTYVIIYSTGIISREEMNGIEVKTITPSGLRPTIGRKWN